MAEIAINPRHNVHKKYRQMIFANPYRFGVYVPPVVNNTFIGGVASVINTPTQLAAKLQNYPSGSAFDEANIQNFTIVGDDIECYIGVDYQVVSYASFPNITNYIDEGNKCKFLNFQSFTATDSISLVKFNGVLNCLNDVFLNSACKFFEFKELIKVTNNMFNSTYKAENIFIPNALTIGDSNTVVNNCFLNIKLGCKIYVHPSMLTVNAGGLEADLAYAQNTRGCIISAVQNYTSPNPITDLSIGTVYATAIQLNFTAPIGSTNTIDFYEVWVNGEYNNKGNTSGLFATDLTPSTVYNIEVKPVDIYYNKSTSNIVTQATTNSSVLDYPINEHLVSYYKMENNVLDSWGTNHGTQTNITYGVGLVGQNAIFNGTNAFVSIPDTNALSFTDGVTDKPFSISYILNTTDTQFYIINKNSSTKREFECEYYAGKLYFRVVSLGNSSNKLEQTYTIAMTGVNLIITHTYDCNGIGGLKTYVNGVLVASTSALMGTYVRMENTTNPITLGGLTWNTSYFLNGKLDEVSFFNKALNASEVSEINAKLLSGQSLI